LSDDEMFVLVGALCAAVVGWGLWYWRLGTVAAAFSPAAVRVPLFVAPPACAVILLGILGTLSAHDVRDSPAYMFFYLLLGAAWVGGCAFLFPLMGLSARDDAVERGNAAATWALSGALAGFTLGFAGGNIGDGPGWWVVVFSAMLPTGVLFLSWWVLGRFGKLAEILAVDRDLAAGIRFAGFMIGQGLVVGRAAAGDWEGSMPAVVDFFRFGWVAFGMLALEMLLGRFFRPTPRAPAAPLVQAGVAPGLCYVVIGAAFIFLIETVPGLSEALGR
jgi:hypothetical protein